MNNYRIFNKILKDPPYHVDLAKVFSTGDIITIEQVIKEKGQWENDLYLVTKHNEIRCRWCKLTKPINQMTFIGLVSGVCDECYNAPDAEERHAKYLMEGMGQD